MFESCRDRQFDKLRQFVRKNLRANHILPGVRLIDPAAGGVLPLLNHDSFGRRRHRLAAPQYRKMGQVLGVSESSVEDRK
jgi:hypothetical protein